MDDAAPAARGPAFDKAGGVVALAVFAPFVVDVAATRFSAALGHALSAAEALMAVSVFLLTRRHFHARGFRAADAPLIACAVLAVAIWAIVVIGGISFDRFRTGALGLHSFWPIALQIAVIALLIALCWFADKCHDYAKAQGRLWKAVAIVYQVATVALILYLLPMVAEAASVVAFLGTVWVILGTVGMLTFLAAWILHALALLLALPATQPRPSS
jgi:dipeptide/tripeptide permease